MLRVFQKPSANSDIYDAVDSVITSLNFILEYKKKRSERGGCRTEFYHSRIMHDAVLYENLS